MTEKIHLSLLEDFFESPSPADYTKILINTKNPDENKDAVAGDRRHNIRFKRRNKKNE